jgi:hypothetical protein
VPFSVQVGLLLALVTSLMSVLGFFLEHVAALGLAPISLVQSVIAGGLVLVTVVPLLGVAAGLLWAGSDITIKALSGKAGQLGAGVLVHPFAFVIVVLSLVGLLVSARSLQLGPAVP